MRHIWALEPNYSNAMITDFTNMIATNGSIDVSGFDKLVSVSETLMKAEGSLKGKNNTVSNNGQVAVISISGPMMKNDQMCGPKGTASIGEMIKAADADVNISGIVLSIDSPGGTVDGTETLGNIIKGTKKPIVGFVDNMAASAGYWAISQCDEIILGGKVSGVGSIGVCANFLSIKDALAKAGIVEHNVYASASTDKNKSYHDLINNGDATEIVAQLDKYNAVFHDTVKAGRGDKINSKENVFTGKMYTGKEAVKAGLVDSIGTLQDAVNNAATKIYSKNKNKMKATNLMALLAWAELPIDAKETGVSLQPSEVEAVEDVLLEMASLRENATATSGTLATNASTIADLQKQLDTANASLVAITKERDVLASKTSTATNTALDEEETNVIPATSIYVNDGFSIPNFRK
jgi:signal peptide peptidase SppA